jgi:hypothetical protein
MQQSTGKVVIDPRHNPIKEPTLIDIASSRINKK